ncbi:MAG TPA: DJ-1/PfpI family protein, partial [Myxococcota bacterium]|nr:DJ-1/PfpI family protein [Myxococcota bacterium]
MRKRWWLLGSIPLLCAGALGAFALSLPSARPRGAPLAPVPESERAALLAQLRPPKRARPLVAVLANASGTETTDFVVPLGVLRASGAADVAAVGMSDAPVTLMPALRVRPDLDAARFDAEHPDGADYVIVPALHRADDPAVLAWLRGQARSGAVVVGICDGAWVLGAAGLLDGRSATTHWFSRARLAKSVAGMRWVPDRRYVADGRVLTTTGVSASLPASLTLVEAIAGRARAEELAAELGVPSFGAEHASRAFVLDRAALWTAAANRLAPWRHEEIELELRDGVDEVALALTADAWARTYRASVRARGPAAQVTS